MSTAAESQIWGSQQGDSQGEAVLQEMEQAQGPKEAVPQQQPLSACELISAKPLIY